jgi:hypothetical protein
MLGSHIPAISARDSFAPAWLKEGVYATYVTDEENSALIFNITDPQYRGLDWLTAPAYDQIKYWNASLTWRCISTNDTTAQLQVTFDYVGEELFHFVGTELSRIPLNNASLQLNGKVYVDLYTRAVYTADGTLLGTTHLWLPANPREGQNMVVWDVPPKTITLPAAVNNVWFETIQGKQDGFQISGTITVSDNGKGQNIMMFYDLDTGLGVGGYFQWDPIMAAIGIYDSGLKMFSDTNIDLGAKDTSLNWTIILQYAILPTAVVLLVVAFVIKRKKKRN